jgi:hypothetical protein
MIGFGLLIKQIGMSRPIYPYVTIEMKWVDWLYLLDLPAPIEEVMQAVQTRCQFMGIAYLMGLRCDYSQEVVAQFYATLYVD